MMEKLKKDKAEVVALMQKDKTEKLEEMLVAKEMEIQEALVKKTKETEALLQAKEEEMRAKYNEKVLLLFVGFFFPQRFQFTSNGLSRTCRRLFSLLLLAFPRDSRHFCTNYIIPVLNYDWRVEI